MERHNERRIIQVVKRAGANYPEKASQLLRELGQSRRGMLHELAYDIKSITYLFEKLDDAHAFGDFLDERLIPFSTHPARDYNSSIIGPALVVR
ncbi:MAG: hypothetical protein KKD18_05320 [Nanoarchaeota archaeon]|nr:hypothetical protein [Nanoarchaeota archaeon]MBU0977810.1 hypothetical protein [Nanoarchaeota archaeon]